MIDQSGVNLLNLIGADVQLKRVASTHGGEYVGPCPFCKDGDDRFHVWPNEKNGGRFWCRICGKEGDSIAYIQMRDNVGFKEACQILNIGLDKSPNPYIQPTHKPLQSTKVANSVGNPIALSDEAWQHGAHQFLSFAQEQLWKQGGHHARQYLANRGISETIMRDNQLGYNPSEYSYKWSEQFETSASFPRGIVIPLIVHNVIWKLNVRRLEVNEGESKYKFAKGSANGLFGIHKIMPHKPIIMVEGEFDAMVLNAYQDEAVAVATVTASGSRVLRWQILLSTASQVLLAFDADEAGESASKWWGETLSNPTIRLKPSDHDVTDMYLLGRDLSDWVKSGLAS